MRAAEQALEPWHERQRARAREIFGPEEKAGLNGKRWADATRQALNELEDLPAYRAAIEAHLSAIEGVTRADTSVNEHGRVWVYLRKAGPVTDSQLKAPQ